MKLVPLVCNARLILLMKLVNEMYLMKLTFLPHTFSVLFSECLFHPGDA